MGARNTPIRDTTLTVTAKGQITLRKDVLQHLGAHPGSKLDISMLPDGAIKLTPSPAKGKIVDFCGSLKRDGQRPISIEEMNDIIERGWAGQL
ncbi:MAG: AbrB/MazE/SpoVT family DNA-binding domain-containing protein [Novosphingobium sp.]